MNAELIPAYIALTGGATALAAVLAYERHRDSEMRAGRVRLAIRFPLDVDEAAVTAVLRGLTGLDYRHEVLIEVHAQEGEITHVLSVPHEAVGVVESTLHALMPGVRLEPGPALDGTATVSTPIFVPTPVVLETSDIQRSNRAILGAAGRLRGSERVVLRWALGSGRPRPWNPPDASDHATKQRQRAWEKKTATVGLRAAGLILVSAETRTRAQELADRMAAVLRSREGSCGRLRLRRSTTGRPLSSAPRLTRSSGWLTIDELAGLAGWPVGPSDIPGLQRGGVRELLVPPELPREGRILFMGRDVYGDRPVALGPIAALQHEVVLGGSGSGKSTLIGNGILNDIRAGRGGAAIDPKNDLVDDVLDRVDPRDADRIVVLDPADDRPTPGIDFFGTGDADLRTDLLVGAFASLFAGSFGIRSQIYLRLGIRTLAGIRGATLLDLPRLFADPSFRAEAVRALDDPVMQAQWQAFDALSPAAQAEHVQSPMAKVANLLSRPAVRAVLASPDPKLDIPRILAEGRWLLVSLSPGKIGEPAAQLLASVLAYTIWSAVEGRAALPPDKRTPVSLVIDELATVAALPISLELLLERARGLGAGVVVGLQSLARIPEPLRAALSANALTFITFRAGADDAPRVARELPGLIAAEVQALGRYEVAARIGKGSGSEVAIVTGTSRPWPELTHQGERIREMSSIRYGAQPAPKDETHPDKPSTHGRTRRQP